jgi:neutral trehalase
VLWNDDYGIWLDYCPQNSEFNANFYPSNLMPLWAGVAGDYVNKDVIIALVKSWDILSFPGGVPTSFMHVRNGYKDNT